MEFVFKHALSLLQVGPSKKGFIEVFLINIIGRNFTDKKINSVVAVAYLIGHITSSLHDGKLYTTLQFGEWAIVTLRPPNQDALRDANIKYKLKVLDVDGRFERYKLLLRARKPIVDFFKRTEVKVILLDDLPTWFVWLALKTRKYLGIPIVLRLRGDYDLVWKIQRAFRRKIHPWKNLNRVYGKIYTYFYKWGLKHCDLIICHSNDLREKLVKQYKLNPGRVLHMRVRGININKTRPRYTTNTTKLKLVYGGRISSEKNLEHFLSVTRNDADIEIEIYGPIDSEEYFECLKRVSSNWIYKGSVSHAEMLEKLRDADMLFINSLTEGSPRIVLEAMACGKPILYPAIPPLIEMNPYGFRHNFTNLHEVLQHIKKCDRNLLKSLGVKNRIKVEREFSLDNEKKLVELIGNIAKT